MSTQSSPKKLAPSGIDFTPTIHSETYDFVKPSQFDLSGRAVFITGASKGIGRETALSYAKAGTSFIAVGARSSLDSIEKDLAAAAKAAGRKEPKVLAVTVDVEDNASVEAAAKKVEESFGRLDILINNAGYAEKFTSILDSDPEEWRRSYMINVVGLYQVTKAFLPLVLKTQDGLKEIVNLSSIGAFLTNPGGSAYKPGKLAVLRFGEFIHAEYPEVLSLGLHPGGVQTDLSKSLGEAMQHVLIDSPALAGDTIVFLTAERREWLQNRYVSVTWDMKELLAKRQKIEDEDLLKVKLQVGFE